MKQKPVFIILGILAGLNILAWIAVLELSFTQYLEVTFFDIGQGDSIFIETPENHQILIDGGPTSVILEKLGEEMSFWDRTIDLIVLSHPEHDHIAGLIEVLKRYKVENILWTGVLRDTAEYREWQKLINEEGAQIHIAQAGQKINCSKFDSEQLKFNLDILYPRENLAGKEVANTNNTSAILHLVYGENSFLFTGDAYQSVERELIDKGIEIESDVLKVGHHGSKTSTASEFIEKVSLEIAVISVGKDNSYGHPHEEVLAILAKYGTNIVRTDLNGDIKFLCNFQSLKLKSQD